MENSFPDRIKLPFVFDPSKMKNELLKLRDEEWIEHMNKLGYAGSWKILPFRGPANAVHPIQLINCDPSCKEFKNTELLERCEYFQEILEKFECSLLNVRLMNLLPGSIIKEHTDMDLSIEDGIARFHVPVLTNPKVVFFVNRKKVKMKEGECWYLKLSDPHAVANYSNGDRIHLVIDCEVNDWVINALNEGINVKQNFFTKLFY